MTDYNNLKVPDLKRILGDRSLPLSGNKADLIARLQEDDEIVRSAGVSAPPIEDEIDWDEDDTKEAAAPVVPAVAVAEKTPAANPVVASTPKVDIVPAKTGELKVPVAKNVPAPVTETKAPAAESTAEATAAAVTAEAPKADFSIGLKQTDAEKEAEKRAARAKRFGIAENDEEKKKLERAKKFGVDKDAVTKGLDDALPEGKAKRGREGDQEGGGRASKRQTPDRRTEVAQGKAGKSGRPARNAKPVKATKATKPTAKKAPGRVLDDPAEKAKAEARAKRFQITA